MDNLEIQASNHKNIMAFNTELLEKTLEKTKGEGTMSDKDVKFSIVVLMGVIKDQEKMIKTLTEEVTDLKQKSIIKNLFKK